MNLTCPECSSVFRVDPAKVPAAGVRARCSVCGGIIAVEQPQPVMAGVAVSAGDAGAQPQSVTSPPAPHADAADVAVHGKLEGGTTPDVASVGAAAWTGAETPAVDAADAPGEREGAASSRPDAVSIDRASDDRANEMTPVAELPAEIAPTAPAATAAAESPGRPATPEAPRVAPPEPPRPVAQPRVAPRRVNPYLANDPAQKARRLARALVSDLVAYHPEKREEGLRAGTLKELFREDIRKSWQEYVEQVGAQTAEGTPYFQDALNDILAGGRRVF